MKDADIRAQWAPLIENLPRLGQALVLLYGGYLAINGQATVGDIVAFNAYVLMLQPPFRQLGMILMMGQRAAASAQRIYEVLDEQPTSSTARAPSTSSSAAATCTSTTCRSTYANGTAVLDDFDLHLRPGETVALVGRTGSGKSTAARLLARFYDVTGGAVRVDGHDVRDLTLPSLRHHIGMVLDEPFLFSVSIRDNIAYGRPDASFDDVVAAAQAAGADEFIRAMPEGYDTVVGERGFTLSGGQRQRIVDRPHAAGEPADPGARRRDVGHRRADRAADPRRAAAADGRPHDADHRPPALDHQPRRPCRRGGGRTRHRPGHPRRAARPGPAYAEILAQSTEDARIRDEDRRTARDAADDRDERLLRQAIDEDVLRTRDLDADVGELADLDPDLAPVQGPN